MLGQYDILMRVARGIVLAASALAPDESSAKFMRFGRGQRRVLSDVAEVCEGLDRSLPTVWLHCSSLGEYGIARPIISRVKGMMTCNVVVSFFSPTGYEALTSRPHVDGDPDAVCYLPLDTAGNAKHFLDTVNPSCAVFMVSEYWHNYLHELHNRQIPTILVSAIIREDGPFFKWYGDIYRSSIKCFDRIFALDRGSVERLESVGAENATVGGDPLFDNAALVASTPWSNPVVERFVADRKVFMAGSIHRDQDLEMIARLANKHTDTPFIIVPHEITLTTLCQIEKSVKGEVKRLSQCAEDEDFSSTRALVVDSVGSLAYLYRYATWAYVGGGFSRFLHSIIEPVVYGVPVAFGPIVTRKVTPRQIDSLGIGKRVEDFDQLDAWFSSIKDNPQALSEIKDKAKAYVDQNVGATGRVAQCVVDAVKLKQSGHVE